MNRQSENRNTIRKFIVNELTLDTSMPKAEIEKMTQLLFNQKYGDGKIGFTYNLKRKDKVELTFSRKMKYDVKCDVLKAEDCVILSGLNIKNFQIELGKSTPFVAVFPYLSDYYVPIPELSRLLSELTEGEENTVFEIIPTEDILKVNIKFR